MMHSVVSFSIVKEEPCHEDSFVQLKSFEWNWIVDLLEAR